MCRQSHTTDKLSDVRTTRFENIELEQCTAYTTGEDPQSTSTQLSISNQYASIHSSYAQVASPASKEYDTLDHTSQLPSPRGQLHSSAQYVNDKQIMGGTVVFLKPDSTYQNDESDVGESYDDNIVTGGVDPAEADEEDMIDNHAYSSNVVMPDVANPGYDIGVSKPRT